VQRELTNIEKTQRLKFALAGDACNAIYLNLATAGSVLLLFLDRLGLDVAQMGVLLAAIGFGPMIAPLTAQVGARLGFRRVFLTFTTLRVLLLSGMIFAPLVARHYGSGAAFSYVAVILVAFGLARSTAESMGGPWSTEFIPPAIRGKYTALQMIVSMLCGAAAIFSIGEFLGPQAPVARFQTFFIVALAFGLLPALFYTRVPGGAPQPEATFSLGNILLPLKDRVYRRHLLGHMTINFGWFATMPFVPLYMKNHVGLPPDQVVTLDAMLMLGSLCSSFLWGWAADRYGGKPVMVSLLTLHVMMPLGLLMMPHHSEWSHVAAMTLYFAHGFIGIGWVIGFFRYFFINLVPQTNRTAYIALNTCMAGLMVGSGPLWAGWVLSKLSHLSGSIGPFSITPHTPFFVGLIVCVIIATWLMAGLPDRGGVGVRQFATLFFQGNPLATVTGLMAFRNAGIEGKRVAIVERLGATRSPLSVNELIEALDDPSFSVRYEAIVSAARTVRDPRLTEALLKLLKGADPGLQMAAVWALGRTGGEAATPTLRDLLDSPYRSMRAQVARALGMLHDVGSGTRLIAMFHAEVDPALRVAYGSAIAALGRSDALPNLLDLLREVGPAPEHEHRRREVSLAVATLIGPDDAALRLWRRMHDQPGDTLGGVLLAARNRLARPQVLNLPPLEARNAIERAAYAFAADDLPRGLGDLRTVLQAARPEAFSPEAARVLAETQQMLSSPEPHAEYIFLAVHALHVGLKPDGAA
jgi:MFS family permease